MSTPRMTPNPRSGGRGISEPDVWEAADALLMAGQRPTIERIRQQLGRGSPNTVSPYLDAWFAGLGARLAGRSALAGAPDAVPMPEPVARAAMGLWDLAVRTSRDALAAEAAERAAALDAREAVLNAEREALEQARAVLHERVAAAEVAAADARQARDEAQAQARRAEAQLVGAQADAVESRRQLTAARQAGEAMQAEQASQRAGWDDERARLNARAEANERRLMVELDGTREALKALQQDRKQWARQLEDAETANVALRETQRAQETARALQEAAMDRLREQLAAQEVLAVSYQALLAAPREPVSPVGAGSQLRRRRAVTTAGTGVAAGGLRRGRRQTER